MHILMEHISNIFCGVFGYDLKSPKRQANKCTTLGHDVEGLLLPTY